MAASVAVFCFLLAAIAVTWAIWALRKRQQILTSWIRLDDASIVDLVEQRSAGLNSVVLIYEYQTDGARYLGRSILPWGTRALLAGRGKRAADQLRENDVISVFVNPENRQESVVQPMPPAWICLLGLFGGALCCLLGALLLYQAVT